MASLLRTVFGQLKTKLALPNGSGSYTYDLSGTDQVKLGFSDSIPARLPIVYVLNAVGPSEHGPDLGAYIRRWTIPIMGLVAGTDSNNETRLLAAADLLNDLLIALETDRTLGGNVRDIIPTSMEVQDSSQVVGVPGYGVAWMTLQVYYRRADGVGV